MKKIGLYIHFPFCKRKCRYCDFPSYDDIEDLMPIYLKALKSDIQKWGELADEVSVQTIFMGGGTPTLFKDREVIDILESCAASWTLEEDAEVTIEANPGTLRLSALKNLRNAGFNRISLGMQAWQKHHLECLGRIHSSSDVVQSVEWCRKAGFNNINLDVMFGLPRQTLEDWLETLKRVVDLDVEHVSAYSLKIEDGTPLYEMVKKGKLVLPSEELEREMYHQAIDYLKNKGYTHYEISNFAKPGKQCRHNLIYWKNGEYIGLGSGAHSYWNGERFANITDPKVYIEKIQKGESPIEFEESISKEDEKFETIMLGLRLMQGVSKKEFFIRFGEKLESCYGDIIEQLKDKELLIEDQKFIRLTSRGMDLQNTVLLCFMR